VNFHREDISFHFSLGFTALMRRFTGNRSLVFPHNNTATKLFANSLFNQKSIAEESIDKKELQSYSQNNSNLNSFAFQNDQTNNLLLVLQGFQMVANRSNVVLFAVGGIVSEF
jgi:hypothetical protein